MLLSSLPTALWQVSNQNVRDPPPANRGGGWVPTTRGIIFIVHFMKCNLSSRGRSESTCSWSNGAHSSAKPWPYLQPCKPCTLRSSSSSSPPSRWSPTASTRSDSSGSLFAEPVPHRASQAESRRPGWTRTPSHSQPRASGHPHRTDAPTRTHPFRITRAFRCRGSGDWGGMGF